MTAEAQLRQFTAHLQLETLFVLNDAGRIVSTREPNPTAGPAFALIRGPMDCACAVNATVPEETARALLQLAATEPPVQDFRAAPVHATRYTALLHGRVDSGPAFTFPNLIDEPEEVVRITSISLLERHFRGWTADELPERAPIMAIMRGGHAVSICYCARRSEIAAEAGVDTASPFRGEGLGPRVTAAWARAIRAEGLLPLYSTSWGNDASLAVARKLGLTPCAADWSVDGGPS